MQEKLLYKGGEGGWAGRDLSKNVCASMRDPWTQTMWGVEAWGGGEEGLEGAHAGKSGFSQPHHLMPNGMLTVVLTGPWNLKARWASAAQW